MRHRGELTDQEWERLEPLLPPEKTGDGVGRTSTIDGSSTGFCGESEPGRRGAICRSGMGRGRRCTAGSGGGGRPGSGIGSSRPSSSEADAAGEVDWERPVRRWQRDPRAPARRWCKGGAQKRRRWGAARAASDQGAPQGRGPGQAADGAAHPWSAARIDRLRAAHAPGRHPTTGTRPAARPARAASRATKATPAAATAPPSDGAASARPSPSSAPSDRSGPFDRAAYRRRHLIENLFARCKQYRALATRYDKRADVLPRRLGDCHDYPLATWIAFAYRP